MDNMAGRVNGSDKNEFESLAENVFVIVLKNNLSDSAVI
jgi:hypothetical protein